MTSPLPPTLIKQHARAARVRGRQRFRFREIAEPHARALVGVFLELVGREAHE